MGVQDISRAHRMFTVMVPTMDLEKMDIVIEGCLLFREGNLVELRRTQVCVAGISTYLFFDTRK